MELTIEQPCPSCGAPINIKENDRLIRCEFCDVKNYRIHQRLPRYILPTSVPSGIHQENLLYMPYLRFKGSVFYCRSGHVGHKFIDTTRSGGRLDYLPVSLGVRPQAMPVHPVTAQLPGRFVPRTEKAEKIFSEAAKLSTLFQATAKAQIVHRAFIGETISGIYLPVYRNGGRVFDAVTNRDIGVAGAVDEVEQTIVYDKSWEPRFLSTICPGCGDTLHAGVNSLVLHCHNCGAAWLEEKGRFVGLEYRMVAAGQGDVRYLPFWQLHVEDSGVGLSSLADLMQLTNQPVVVNSRHREQPLAFLVPGFKLNPNTFLHTTTKMTFLQLSYQQQVMDGVGRRMAVYPTTLPYREAIQALKTILAASAVSAKRVISILPEVKFSIKGVQLLYIPFRPSSHDWIEEETGFSIPAAALRFGRRL